MDFLSVVIIISIIASGLIMIIGPLMELNGKILFLESNKTPKVKARWGMGLMVVSFVLFLGGLFLRSAFPSGVVSPIVLGAFVLWFVGGFVAVIRNEVLRIMVEDKMVDQNAEVRGAIDGTNNINN